MKSSARKVELASAADLFSTEQERQDAKLEKLQIIPLAELHPFPDHPFSVKDDDSMQETVESIKERGVLQPAIARPREGGGYELVSGHRRKRACELAGLDTMPVIVRDLDRDTAIIFMVDSNIQRENISPMEKARALKMKMEAIRRQGTRTDLTSPNNSAKFRSDDEIGAGMGMSGDTVRNMISLTQLVPELQQMVDDKKIAMTPAYQIAALKPEEQALLVETIESEQTTPSVSQAQRMKKLSQSGELNEDTMLGIMSEEKKPEVDKIVFTSDTLRKYFPRSYTPKQMQDTIIKLLDQWLKKRQRQQERYLGRRDHYDNWGHYLNNDNSLLHISDNEKMFNFISGGGYSISQADMMAQGALSQDDCAEFDALRVGVLAQFEQVEPFLFAGEPFQFVQPGQEQPEPLDAALPNTKLDEYPVPDASMTRDVLPENSGLLPLSRERAAELLEQDMTVYMVEAGKDPAMIFDRDDLMEQPEGMMFAVPREEWQESQDFRQAVADRLNRQEEREQAFLGHGGDCFAIYQVKHDDAHRDYRYEPLDRLKVAGLSVERANYDLVYTGPLQEVSGDTLENLFQQFNMDRPADYHHPSMSVSDIIALKADGVVADHTAAQITGSYQAWTDFLATAGRLYKYPYNEQLLIYAQRPNATACAEYDFWNERMRRYVRRGSTGIALIDNSSGRPVLRYVFDVSDTGGEPETRPRLWQYREEHQEAVSAALEQRFEVPAGEFGLQEQLEGIASQLAADYWEEHQQDILDIVDGSFLAEYDAFNVGAQFRSAAAVSIAYTLMSRCGLEPENYFAHEDFLNVFDFNTPNTLTELGTAVSQGSETVLRQIEVTIRKYEREKSAERSAEHGEQADVHAGGGLPLSQPDLGRAAGPGPGQVREDAPDVPEGSPSGDVQPSDAERDAVQPPAGDRGRGQQPVGADDAGAGESGGGNGGAESQRPDEVGGADEQLQGPGGGNYSVGADLQLSFMPPEIPSQREQIEAIREAESAEAPSAFSVSQEEVDRALREYGGRLAIYELYQQDLPTKDRVAAIRKKYGTTGHNIVLLDGTDAFLDYRPNTGMEFWRTPIDKKFIVKWSAVEMRIRQLIQDGSYLSPVELEKYQSDHLEDVSAPVPVPQAAESEKDAEIPAPASEPIPQAVTQDDIDGQLRFGAPMNLQNLQIYELFQQDLSTEARVKAVGKVFGVASTGHPLPYGAYLWTDYSPDVGIAIRKTVFGKETGNVTISWADAEKRLRQLIGEGRYLTPEEMEQYRQTHPEQVKTEAAQMPETEQPVHVPGGTPPIPATVPPREITQAINTLQAIELEGRSATPAEQEILSRYVGWGGLPDAFDPDKPNWTNEFLELQAALTPEEYASARASTLNAHYTRPAIIKAIYEAVENMGFKTGNILEPSCGVGNFFGLLPESMAASKLYGVELDSITGRIAQQLYPKANIAIQGFEKSGFPDGFFDLAIGNVPFGGYKLVDRRYDKENLLIHDYFFAKTIDKVRSGGVIAFITSNGISGGTMDKKDRHAREYIARRCDLLGAIRLPSNASLANAGTEAGMDIVFLQKRDVPLTRDEPLPEWVDVDVLEQHTYTGGDGQEKRGHVTMSRYFQAHPEMVLGNLEITSGPYGAQLECKPILGADLAQQLHEAVSHIHGEYREAAPPELDANIGEPETEYLPADPSVKNYSYAIVDGEVYYRENSLMAKANLTVSAKERVKGMVELRDCVRQLIDMQMDEYTPDSAIKEKQGELNRLYDDFAKKYGLINDRANRLAFSADSAYYLLCALEVLDEDGRLERKADMFTKRTIKPHRAVTSVDTAMDALAVSIGERACVDLPFMAQLTGMSEEALIEDLRGVIFKDPLASGEPFKGWQTADEYLSGNVREKLRAAEMFAASNPAYQVNVDALTAAQPKDLDASEIEVRLGATWIDKKYIQQFMYETLKTPYYLRGKIKVSYSPHTAEWSISNKGAVGSTDITAYSTYGTDRANAYRILEDSLNLRDVRIYDTIEDADGKEKRVLNAKETTLAAQKQQALRDAFREWIFKDPERRQTLVRQYNEEMNCIRPREYDGSHIVFSGINPEIQLQPHQVNAIAHVLYGGNTLLAHEVGAGKTFEMIAAAMESKRLGLCHKSIFVVPNHLTEQTAAEFLRLYPSANILVTTKKDFEKHRRKKFCARIATGNYDAVIIGHSQFEKIPISMERQERLIQEQIWEITEGIQEVQDSGGERFTVKQLERTKRNLEARLEKLQANHRKDDVVTFEQLGVDMMFVDESDNYKNLFLYTKMRNVAGLSTTDAQKSSDMFAKCRYLDEITNGRGVVFATGTPISNSMTEMYTIQRYLQYDRLQEMGMGHFDCWASRFGETVTALELAPEGTGYRARTRFAKFFNLPELMNIFKEVADIKTADQLNLPTPEVEYHTVAAKPTEIQQEMVKQLSERASRVHSGTVDPREDNMLKITNDGRKLGLDQRIINPMLPDEAGTKVNQCVENVLQCWRDGDDKKLTQLIFCDISTPKAAPSKRSEKGGDKLDDPTLHMLEASIPLEREAPFTIYEDIRQKLIAGGMAPEQIAFIHEANTDVQKKELFAKVRSGQVRVLIGSTFKMGAGTNVQDLLIALHDLDCPWRPRDLTQRKGRIERRGNTNEKVHVYRYVTEGTFDAYLWQTVENKQKFISQIMTSKSPMRSCEDVDEAALSYAEIKALCAGDPRIKERMELDVDVSKLKIMKAAHQSKQYEMEDNLMKHFPEQIRQYQGYIKGLEADMKTLADHPHPTIIKEIPARVSVAEGQAEGTEPTEPEKPAAVAQEVSQGFAGMVIKGTAYEDREAAGAALIEVCQGIKDTTPVEIGSYRGFTMSVGLDLFKHELSLRGEMTHKVELSADPRGNLIRIDNALGKMPERLTAVKAQLDNLFAQQEAARQEVGKPFPQEDELRDKSARLAELDALLNIDGGPSHGEQAIAKSVRPSVLEGLKRPPQPGPDRGTSKPFRQER